MMSAVRFSQGFVQLTFLCLLVAYHAFARIYKVPLQRAEGLVREEVLISDTVIKGQENNLHGKPGQGYFLAMEIGTPPQKLNILVDTGSSNFAIAAAPHPDIDTYFRTDLSTSHFDSGRDVYVPYTQGNWKGTLITDVVSVDTLPNITVRANIATILSSSHFFINGSHWQGILGLAYAEIARPDSTVEPFFDSLVSQTGISNLFSMQLCGALDTAKHTDVSMGGSMVIGGVDSTLYQGPMLYSPIHKQWYYEIVVTDMAVDGKSLGLDCKEYNFDKTIVDSGTTNLRLPKKVFAVVLEAVKAATRLTAQQPTSGFWLGTEVLCWPIHRVPYKMFPFLSLTVIQTHNTTFTLNISPQQYLRPVGGGTENEDCYKFAIASSDSGTVLGAVVMEGFYVVFDTAHRRVGFAQTTCKVADESSRSTVTGPFPSTKSTLDCAYVKPKQDQSTLLIVAYVMAAVCGACVIPLLAMVIQWQWQKCRQKQEITDISSLLRRKQEEGEDLR